MIVDVRKYKAVLFDLDGTVYEENHPLPGAAACFERLTGAGVLTGAITNSGTSPAALSRRLGGMGIGLPEGHIYSCVAHAAEYILETWGEGGRKPRVLSLSTDGFHELLEGKVRWVETAGEACDAVAVAAPNNHRFSLDRLFLAQQHLLRPATQLLGMCADRCFTSKRGVEIGSGGMTALLAYSASKEPVFFGKPLAGFIHTLCRRMGVAAAECLLVGDNLESDIAGARAAGMDSALILTGVVREIEGVPVEKLGTYVIGSLDELVVG
jgi:4-nitrophenyl phosphatase